MQYLQKPLGTLALWLCVTLVLLIGGSYDLMSINSTGLTLLCAFFATIVIWCSQQTYCDHRCGDIVVRCEQRTLSDPVLECASEVTSVAVLGALSDTEDAFDSDIDQEEAGPV